MDPSGLATHYRAWMNRSLWHSTLGFGYVLIFLDHAYSPAQQVERSLIDCIDSVLLAGGQTSVI